MHGEQRDPEGSKWKLIKDVNGERPAIEPA
jgi:hypothetical protein